MKKKPSIANACASLAVSMMLVGVAEAETVQTFTIKEQTLSLDEEFVWIAKKNENISYVHGAEEGPTVYPKDRYVIQLERVNFHSKCKILGGVAEFFSKAFLCRFPPENFPRPVVYPVHSLPV